MLGHPENVLFDEGERFAHGPTHVVEYDEHWVGVSIPLTADHIRTQLGEAAGHPHRVCNTRKIFAWAEKLGGGVEPLTTDMIYMHGCHRPNDPKSSLRHGTVHLVQWGSSMGTEHKFWGMVGDKMGRSHAPMVPVEPVQALLADGVFPQLLDALPTRTAHTAADQRQTRA